MSLLASAVAAPKFAAAQSGPSKTVLYASVGPELAQYDVDIDGAALTRRGTVTLPANVQYVWPHASRRYLYVASSSSASGTGPAGDTHHVTAFRIDTASGTLTPHGNPIALPTRPIHTHFRGNSDRKVMIRRNCDVTGPRNIVCALSDVGL